MEISINKIIIQKLWRCTVMLFVLMVLSGSSQAQVKNYKISKGNMQVSLGKNLPEKELDEFIKQYDLGDLALKQLIRINFRDSVNRKGWKIEINNKELVVISKPLFAADVVDAGKLAGIYAANKNDQDADKQAFGRNVFRNNHFFSIKDSSVIFIYRYNKEAKKVLLAGDFTNWQSGALPMKHTDSGWVVSVKLSPGKYLYKFIADGRWLTDADNTTTENDDKGNTNSVYYVTNTLFQLAGFQKAKKVLLSGSFNNWNEQELRMNKTAAGWELPLYLRTGEYTYRFIVDKKWMIDSANKKRLPNEFNEFNSVVSSGKPTLFELQGFQNAATVFLAGSFNQWRDFELPMTKTAGGWRISYVIGPGNYEYKFYVAGKWLDAAGKQIEGGAPGTVFVIDPNYTFRYKNPAAKTVILAGDFNGWSPNAYAMKKEGDSWILAVHLPPGKHLYKFIVDGKWIRDPDNKLWEENEFDSGNSILWVK